MMASTPNLPEELAKDRRHPLRRIAVRDALALGVLASIVLGMFLVTELYYSAYMRYRARLGLPTDTSPVISMPIVRRHR